MDSESPSSDDRDRDRRRLERILPELLKRLVEAGVGKLSEGRDDVRAFVNEMKLPKELSTVVAAQLEATKNALASSVAQEVRRFLERTSIKDALSGLTLEVKTQVRVVPSGEDRNDHGSKTDSDELPVAPPEQGD